MLEHRKCGLHFLQEKILIYYQISPGGWLQQMAPTKSSNPLWQILGICKSTLHRLFYTRLFVCTKWFYQWLWMYVYLCVAVMLTLLLLPNCAHYPSEKNLCFANLCNMYMYASIVYASVCNVYMYLLQKNLYVPIRTFCMLAIPLKHALRVYAARASKE